MELVADVAPGKVLAGARAVSTVSRSSCRAHAVRDRALSSERRWERFNATVR